MSPVLCRLAPSQTEPYSQLPSGIAPCLTEANMLLQIRQAFLLLVVLSLLTGIIYPLVITAIAQVVFPQQANGRLIYRDGKPVGSSLIGQPFTDPKYFWSRPSATSPTPYNAESSGGSNLGPTNPDFTKAVAERIAAFRKADPGNDAPIPIALVTSSASGLDPHISPAAAEYQVGRVAKARGMDENAVRRLAAKHTEGRTLGLLGEPRVNVVELNLDLDGIGRGNKEIPGVSP
jgi:K+-transporting ATPase ATPase C chain